MANDIDLSPLLYSSCNPVILFVTDLYRMSVEVFGIFHILGDSFYVTFRYCYLTKGIIASVYLSCLSFFSITHFFCK